LHLKLDQLTDNDMLAEIGAIREELERMRDVANQAYEQVRSTLVDLRQTSLEDLATSLLDQARADMQVHLSTAGKTRPLAPQAQQQVLAILLTADIFDSDPGHLG